jgi:SulP family sulfate permease
MFLGAVGVFYIVLWLTGTSVAQAGAQGWLLGPFPEGALWQPLTPSALGAVRWPAIVGQAGNIGTILIISVVSLLLNSSGLELTVRRDVDLNRELQSAGWANLLASLGGGLTGYHALSLSALGHRMGTHSRLVGLLVALLNGVMLVFGAPLLSLFPKPVAGGLLLFLGLAFVVEWVYDAWFKLPRIEYAIVILIMITMPTVGILPGVGLGLIFAVILFAISYSRISVVKHVLSGSNYRSNVDRPRSYRQILHRNGHWLCILELQGFIFFGTANDLLDRVRQRLQDLELPSPCFVVLDFRKVMGLDASAVLSFAKMKQLAQRYNAVLVFSHLSAEIRRRLAREVLTDEDKSVWHTEADLDHGVEWCEEQMLSIFETERTPGEDSVQPESFTSIRTLVPGLEKYLEHKEFEADTVMIGQGDAPRGLYFIVSGQVTAQLEGEDEQIVRLRKMGPGSVVGEMGLYRDSEASASVLVNEPSTADFLSVADLLRMEEEDPEIAVALHRYVALLLSDRLAYANSTLQALLV